MTVYTKFLTPSERVLKNCPTLNAFEANPLAPWIEIFVCDVGCGLLANVGKWDAPTDMPDVKEVLDKVANNESGNPLQALSHILFQKPFSSEERTEGRTSVTGLLHLGLMLQRDSDFARVYTNGEWAGSVHPWNPMQHGSHINIAKLEKRKLFQCAPGTWFSFGIQPVQLAVEYPNDKWVSTTNDDRERLITTLESPPLVGAIPNIRFEDRRTDPHCSLPKEWDFEESMMKENVFANTHIVVLRPPRSIQKRQVGIWLDRLSAKTKTVSPDIRANFVLVDLTPFQAVTYSELLVRHKLPASCDIDIYLVTEDWAVCCLSKISGTSSPSKFNLIKAKELMQADLSLTYPISSSYLLLLLRQADSKLFWAGSMPKDMYLNKPVRWPSSREYDENTPDNERFIEGYLDLSRALVDAEKYHACHRALRRCLNLFPEFDVLASDDLVQSLALDADHGRHRSTLNTQPQLSQARKKIIVGSIRVSSNTVKRFLGRSDTPDGSTEIYIFNHPDAGKFSKCASISVLDWIAPALSSDRDIIYERIPETPYIGEGGEKAIVIPRFSPPTPGNKELTDSFYKRSPQQTYDDFHKLGAIKLGHWIYGSKHDLITINLGRSIELSALDNGPLYRWLITTIKELGFMDKAAAPTILIYPSHPITDKIIAILLDGMAKQVPTESWLEHTVIPIKFLSNNSVSPMRASPLAYDHLVMAVKEAQKNEAKCRIVILDDGTLSGKMFRELEQAIRGLEIKDVHTVALIDRGGLPIYLNCMDEFISEHHCFWRWDVPPLGHHRGCPFCAALKHAAAMQERLSTMQVSGAMGRRLSQWNEVWGAVSVVDHWETHGLEPTQLGINDECDSHRFCIYPSGQDSASHRIKHQTSTGLSAAVMEITRSTPRSYYALEKAHKVESIYGPHIGIEIISTQLLLFFDELDYWERLDRFSELLSLMWQCKEDSDETALAGLCLTLAEDDLLADLWKWLREKLICKRKVPILDARIVSDLLRHRFNRLPQEKQDQLSEAPTDIERHNYLVMFPDMSFRRCVAHVFEILGETHSEIHNMGLWACLKEIEDALSKNDSERKMRRYEEAMQTIQDLIESMNMLDLRFCCDESKDIISPKEDAAKLLTFIEPRLYLKKGQEIEFKDALLKFTERVKEEILDPNSQTSLACRYRSQLVRTTNTKEAVNAFLGETVAEVCSKWVLAIRDKRSRKKHVHRRWLSDVDGNEPNEDKPSIQGANQGKWPSEKSIYFDRHVRHCIYEILTNCVHAPENITNPWNPANQELKATMWWQANFAANRFMEIVIISSCERKEIILAPTEASSGLERVGGEVVIEVIDGGQESSKVGMDKYFSSDNWATARPNLPQDKRIAVTIVRIPLVKTI